jgi:hypothetical protein
MPAKIRSRSKATSRNSAPPSSVALRSSAFVRLFSALESLPGIDGLSERIGGALEPLTSRTTLMDLLDGRWLGHALHPVLSDVSLGLWGSVPVLDLIGDDRGAAAVTVGGCVAAVGTAATGAAD